MFYESISEELECTDGLLPFRCSCIDSYSYGKSKENGKKSKGEKRIVSVQSRSIDLQRSADGKNSKSSNGKKVLGEIVKSDSQHDVDC